MTNSFRALLRDVADGDGADLRGFMRAVERYRADLDHEGHARDSLLTMKTLKRIGAATLPREIVARVGRDLAQGDRATFRSFLGNELLIAQQRDAHVRRGVPHAVADALLVGPSVSYLFALAVGAIGLEWIFRGGVEGADAGRIANDVLDIEYAIAALWVGRLLTHDRGARSRLGDLKELGKAAWPTHRTWFDRVEAVGPEDALATFLAG